MIISRTPYRVSFFGGGTDYPIWYKEFGGSVLATSIDKYCYITCRYLPPFFDHKTRLVYSKIESVEDVAAIEHPVVRETLKYLEIEDGLEIHHDGDLPARTGLGSSSAFTVGLLHCLFALKRFMPTKLQLALEAIHIERNVLKEHVGSQDQMFAAFGGFSQITFTKDDSVGIKPIIMERERLIQFQNHLMLYFTGFSRFASEIAEIQIKNTHSKKKELSSIYGMVDEAIAILSGRRELTDFGILLDESWKLKRSLSEKISTPQIDEIYEAAMGAGALGGKLLGAGGGGFMLFFAKPEDQPRIKEKLGSLLHVPFRFDSNGSQIIFYEPNTSDRDFYFFKSNTAEKHLRTEELIWKQPMSTL